MNFGKSSIIERVARGWLSVVGVSQCVNRGRQQLAVSGEQSGRSDLLKRQTDGGYPSCVRRTRQGDAGEVELGCYELCGCTKGRQCESTGALCGRDLRPFARMDLRACCMGLDRYAPTRTRLPNTVLRLWRLSLSTSVFLSLELLLFPVRGRRWPTGRVRVRNACWILGCHIATRGRH